MYRNYFYVAIVLIIIVSLYYKFFYNTKTTKIVSENKIEEIKDEKIRVPEEVREDTNIKSFPAEKAEFLEKLSFKGEVEADPDRLVQISSRLSGRILKVHFKPGTYVKKGSVLIEIESMEASKLRSKYLGTLTRSQAIEKNKNRLQELKNLRLASEQEFVNADSEYKAIEAELKSDKANLQSMSIPIPEQTTLSSTTASIIEIRSPISGICINRDAIAGGQAEPNKNLGTIGDLSVVWFIIKIFENDLSKVQEGVEAIVRLNSYPDEELKGRLSFISSQVDPLNRTISARIEVQNPQKIARIGLFGEATLRIDSYNVLTVDINSVFERNKEFFAFVESRPGEYEIRKLQIGRKNNSSVEILNGITEGEYVVREGVYNLKARLLKSTFGED